MIVELQLKNLEEKMETGFAEIRQLICGRNIIGNWMSQKMVCATLDITPRHLRRIRIHYKDGIQHGYIKWRKGKGKYPQYYKPDIEKYQNQIVVQ